MKQALIEPLTWLCHAILGPGARLIDERPIIHWLARARFQRRRRRRSAAFSRNCELDDKRKVIGSGGKQVNEEMAAER